MDTVNGRIPAPVDGWSFFPLFRRVLYIQTVVVWDFWTITTSHPLMLPERWTPSSPRCFRDGSCSGFFCSAWEFPIFLISEVLREIDLWCVFFVLPCQKATFFLDRNCRFLFFSTWNRPQKKASYWWTRSCESGTLPTPLKNPAIFLVFFWGNFLPLVWIPFWRSVARLKIPVSRHGSCHLQFSSRQICEWFWTRFGAADAGFGLHKKPTILCSNFHVLSILEPAWHKIKFCAEHFRNQLSS